MLNDVDVEWNLIVCEFLIEYRDDSFLILN